MPTPYPRRAVVVTVALLFAVALPAATDSSVLRERAVRLGRSVDDECRAIGDAGSARLVAEEFAAAGELFEELERCRRSSPFLQQTAEELGFDASEIDRRAYRFLRRVEQRLLGRAQALRAVTLWRAGRLSEVEPVLGTTRDARAELALLLAAHADDLHERRTWGDAAEAFAAARDHRRRALDVRFDGEDARLQFAEAICRVTAGRIREGTRLLRELREARPDYRAADVEQLLSHLPPTEP